VQILKKIPGARFVLAYGFEIPVPIVVLSFPVHGSRGCYKTPKIFDYFKYNEKGRKLGPLLLLVFRWSFGEVVGSGCCGGHIYPSRIMKIFIYEINKKTYFGCLQPLLSPLSLLLPCPSFLSRSLFWFSGVRRCGSSKGK
jgi:hypothetical protein